MGDWVFKKEVALGDVIAIVFAIASVIVAYGTLNSRLSVLESQNETQTEVDRRQDADVRAYKEETVRRLERIEDKLDRAMK